MMTVLVLVPALVYAQVNEDDQYDIQDDTFGGIISNDQTVGPVGIVDELYEAHSDVTFFMENTIEIMGNVGYVEEEVYLEATYVDKENMTLVIWLDPAQMFDPIDKEDILEELGIDVPIEIKYGFFEPQASSSEATSCMADSGSSICYYWGRYVDRCLPTKTTSRCNTYATIISGAGYALPTLIGSTPGPVDTDNDGILDTVDQCVSQPETQNGYQDADGCPDTVPVVASGGTIFQDDFTNGLSNWTVSGQQEWQSGTNDDGRSIPGYTLSNRIAEADDCDDRACILSMTQPLDLSGYTSATLEFHRYVDANHDYGEYLAVEVGNNGDYTQVLRWTHGDGDDQTWHKETVNLSSYLQSGFNVRFVTEQSSSSEDVGIDNVKIVGEASTECVLDVITTIENGSIIGRWDDCGDSVREYRSYLYGPGYRNTYLGSTTGTSTSSSNILEGESYTIKVRVLYKDNNKFAVLFTSNTVTVPVVDRDGPTIMVPSDITVDATSSGNPTVQYVASAYDVIDGTVSVSCTPASDSIFSVGMTTVTCTASDSTGNQSTETFTVTVNEYVTTVPDQCEVGGRTYTDRTICAAAQTASPGLLEYLGISGLQENAHIFGGSTVTFLKDYLIPLDGTTTLVITDSEGINHLLTNHHNIDVVKGVDGDIRIFTWSHPWGITIGTIGETTEVADPDVTRGIVDAGLITITSKHVDVFPNQIRYNGDILNVNSFGGVEDVGDSTIYYTGAKTHGSGDLLFNNASTVVTYNGVRTLLVDQSIANYQSIDGDSGSPVFTKSGSDATLLGIHTGAGCNFTLSNGTTLYQLSLDDLLNCQSTPNSKYAIFGTWENIVKELNIP